MTLYSEITLINKYTLHWKKISIRHLKYNNSKKKYTNAFLYTPNDLLLFQTYQQG